MIEDSSIQGWDFGISGSSPIQLSNTPMGKPHLDLIGGAWPKIGPFIIKDAVTEEVSWLVGRYEMPGEIQWDGQYLVAGYVSGEVLILDFKHMLLQSVNIWSIKPLCNYN